MDARLAIAAPQRSAAEAGAAAVAAGGNALDAALAAAVSLTVSYPDNCALGGDLIALVLRADGTATVVNASGPAPAAIDVDALRAAGPSMPQDGPATVTVPGLVAGLHALWSLGAALPWAAAFDAGITQAETGVDVAPSLAAAFAQEAGRLAADAGTRALFLPGGVPLRAGERLRQPALAATLRRLAHDGPRAFYRGPIGASLVAWLRALGSAMTDADLAGFEPELVVPLRVPAAGREVLTAPPNSQGFLLPQILQAAGPGLDPLGPRAGELAGIFAAAATARDRYLCDPRSGDVPVGDVLDVHPPAGRGDTVAVVAVDGAGNAVSLIQSVFGAFGAGIADASTGVLCHNRGAYFALDPRSPNVLAGGKRPAHTLMPAAVLEAGRPAIVLGTMGGSAQPQILAQVLMRLALGDDPQAALAAPRWVLDGADLLVEAGVPDAARRALAGTGRTIRALPDLDSTVGHTQLVAIDAGGTLTPASDPRSEGAALLV
jgi:gamma-glutamyltranspeptidase/glutathione hydrolase